MNKFNKENLFKLIIIAVVVIAGCLIALGRMGLLTLTQQVKNAIFHERTQIDTSTPANAVRNITVSINTFKSDGQLKLTPLRGGVPFTATAIFPEQWRDTVQKWCGNNRSLSVGDRMVNVDWGDNLGNASMEGCSSHVYGEAGTYVAVARISVISKVEPSHCGGGNGGVGCIPPYPIYTLLWQATSTPVTVDGPDPLCPKGSVWKFASDNSYIKPYTWGCHHDLSLTYQANPNIGIAPLTVVFTGMYPAEGLAEQLDFGDGTITSYGLTDWPDDGRITHIYSKPGTYSVRLLGSPDWTINGMHWHTTIRVW